MGARIYAPVDIAQHKTRQSCWVTMKGNVYDLTPFLEDHPGGDDMILAYGGKDLGKVMEDPTEHVHSNSAYEMMSEFRIGELGGATAVSDDWDGDENFDPSETNVSSDFSQNKFLDLSKPLLIQVWRAPWSKEYYLEQVHNPRHLKESARLFGPNFLEAFTRTNWYVVPIVWTPITLFLVYLSLLQFTDKSILAGDILQLPLALDRLPTPSISACYKTTACFLLGNFIWTLLEYGMHRFLFHIDHYLPDRNWALTLHFLLHGVHHYLPMDRLRLVMPPLLFFVLETPFTKLAHLLFPKAVANGIISGAFAFYIFYDCCHYALHHTRLPHYLAELKRYHLAHHYKNFERGFGVTSPVWDWLCGTQFDNYKWNWSK